MAYHVVLGSADRKNEEALKPVLGPDFAVQGFTTGRDVLTRLQAKDVNLLLIDSDLLDMPGMTLLRFLRETELGKKLPVIYLSSRKTAESLAEGFSLGIEDYLVKPCDPREIAARVNVVLRRRREREEHWGGEVEAGGIKIDPSQRSCLADKRAVTLRPLEFALLELLMRKSGRVLTRKYLLATLWNVEEDVNVRVVDATVSRLRRSLGKRAGALIKTVSKLGYSFRENET
jgi:DNA-binding response OmpR family regulator